MPLRPRTLRARKLRRNATDVERRLWRALREGGLPWKFRRQHPIGRRIADFACAERKLVIELDGGQHADSTSEDASRTVELARHGYRVIRLWNGDILGNLDGVLEAIRQKLQRPTSPRPSPPVGGEGVEQ
jgi:BirA family biotin operon repressor/biotin-[acetyl-CoA-carboxylase] ligase